MKIDIKEIDLYHKILFSRVFITFAMKRIIFLVVNAVQELI